MFDVIVAGAGPAGIATAVALVREAKVSPDRILLLDRAAFPRPKPCGGGLTGHAMHALDALGLRLRVPFVACPRGRLIFGALSKTVRLPRPVAVIRRDEFDADLVTQAVGMGVTVLQGEGVASFVTDENARRVDVVTSRGRSFSARVLVGADGAGSVVRKQVVGRGAGRQLQPLRLARLELPAPPGLGTTMIYDFSLFVRGLRGYVWLFPVPGGRVNVGIMHYPASPLGGRELDELLGEALIRHGVTLPRAARGWPAWRYDANAPVSDRHLLLVGDAAGIDPLTGEGIAVALCHGRIAAREIGQALATSDWAFTAYSRALRTATVGRELSVDRVLAALLYGSSDFRPWLSLVMCDEAVQTLYAARVSGEMVLADEKRALGRALGRHLFLATRRMRALDAARGPRVI